MATLFTSDTHFGHERIIRYCKRPFANVEEMNETLVKNWNSVVGEKDTVYHLGDFALGSRDKALEIAHRLNGHIHLIEGNHEGIAKSPEIIRRFVWIKTSVEIKVEGQHIVLYHYAQRTWHHDLHGAWHLYGHSHGGLEPLYFGKSFDIGVDRWNFTPVTFAQVKQLMDTLPIGPHPRFEDKDFDTTPATTES